MPTGVARPSSDAIRPDIPPAGSGSDRKPIATPAPLAASWGATAPPMPDVAPVTSALRPSSRRASLGAGEMSGELTP